VRSGSNRSDRGSCRWRELVELGGRIVTEYRTAARARAAAECRARLEALEAWCREVDECSLRLSKCAASESSCALPTALSGPGRIAAGQLEAQRKVELIEKNA
jgi:hypothetical protein